jgi:hypothetical protein
MRLPWFTYTEDGPRLAVTGTPGVTVTDRVFEGVFLDAGSVTPMVRVDPAAGDDRDVVNETLSCVGET